MRLAEYWRVVNLQAVRIRIAEQVVNSQRLCSKPHLLLGSCLFFEYEWRSRLVVSELTLGLTEVQLWHLVDDLCLVRLQSLSHLCVRLRL